MLYVQPLQHEAPAVALQDQSSSINVPMYQEEEWGGIKAQLPTGKVLSSFSSWQGCPSLCCLVVHVQSCLRNGV